MDEKPTHVGLTGDASPMSLTVVFGAARARTTSRFTFGSAPVGPIPFLCQTTQRHRVFVESFRDLRCLHPMRDLENL